MKEVEDLIKLKDICLEKFQEDNILFIILYGGAAKYFANKKEKFNDFDINIFFKDSSNIKSTFGMPQIIGNYKDKKIEIMRNRMRSSEDLLGFINKQKSKRWNRIITEPLIQLYPEIKLIIE